MIEFTPQELQAIEMVEVKGGVGSLNDDPSGSNSAIGCGVSGAKCDTTNVNCVSGCACPIIGEYCKLSLSDESMNSRILRYVESI